MLLVASCSLLVDYVQNLIDCLYPHIIFLLPVNHTLHILRHFQISHSHIFLVLINDKCLNIHPVLPRRLLFIFMCALFCSNIVFSLFVPCLLFNPSLLGALPLPCCCHRYLHPHDFYFGPIIPLGHQPGSLLHQQYHPFLCKPRCLHTKLPICTLPALRCLHGSCCPEEHAPAAGGSSALRRATRPLPAGAHCVPTWLPR